MVFLRPLFGSPEVWEVMDAIEVFEVWVEAELGILEEEAVRAEEGCGSDEPGVEAPLDGMEVCLDLGMGIEGRGPLG